MNIPINTADILSGFTTTFASLWPFVAFLGGISIAFMIARRVKGFIRR